MFYRLSLVMLLATSLGVLAIVAFTAARVGTPDGREDAAVPSASAGASAAPVAPPPSPTRSPRRPPPVTSAPGPGGARFFFDPGPMHWCGVFVSYLPSAATVIGELQIGATTFAASSGNPAPFSQQSSASLTAGSWACLRGTVFRSDTTANLLGDFTVEPAADGTLPPAPIRDATACGLITDVFVTDLPSGGFISLAGTKFLVGGLRAPEEKVELPSSESLRIAVSACVAGAALDAVDVATFNVIGGRVFLR